VNLALVLTGGGARAAYQVGALTALAELFGPGPLPFPVVCGVSAGAINGSALAAQAENFPLAVRHLAEPDPFSFPEFPSLKDARDWFEGAYIQRELKTQNGNMTRVAERLGLDRSNLYKRLKALGIEARET